VTTILAVYDSEGCRGRCDSRCHFALSAECDCICGGRYHGSRHDAQRRMIEELLANPELRDRFAPMMVEPDGQLRMLP